ncbi:NAD(P)H-binding protein [Jidongwangia harbinensis]|uniref:NAD(P)H-binding protein n=1 Tax=Jidongwangia harbinensis TaxID=2878561 RepID=UPI001CD96E86|nr:NAD(P)H-binding protein [Jidongwangia harbinensis]MCA2213233.1 NAD(P)H-binding protein [Jidongwangia harbinensis]
MTIAVTTPTGHVGSRVVHLLVQAGVRPVVLVRDPDRLDPALRELVDVARGDLTDADFVGAATRGAEALLWVTPDSVMAADPVAEMTRIGANGAAAVRANRIARTVLISSVGAERRHGVGLIDGLARSEEALAAAGGSLLILRCGFYFTNLLAGLDELRAGTLTTTMSADTPQPWVDPRDVGEVAAARLLATDWSGVAVQAVHGPADLTWRQAAGVVAAATGRPIDLRVVSDADLRAGLVAAGLSEAAADAMVGMTVGLRDGYVPEQLRSPASATPTTLESWAYAVLRPLLR